MSISTLESRSSRLALDRMHREEDERAAEVESLRVEFLSAAQRCDAKAIATFAGRTADFTNKLPGGGYGSRAQSVAEVIEDALTSKDFGARAMQILLNAAAGRGTQRDAQQLIEEAAAHWADLQV